MNELLVGQAYPTEVGRGPPGVGKTSGSTTKDFLPPATRTLPQDGRS